MGRVFIAIFLQLIIIYKVSAQETEKKEEKPTVKVWGMIFGDLQYRSHTDSLLRGTTQYAGITYPDPHNFSEFAIRRIYIGGDFTFSDKLTCRLLLANEGNADNQKNATFSIKEANICWNNIYKNANLLIGRAPTPAYPLLTENVWSYRAIEKTIADMRYLSTPVDLGVGIQAKLNDSGTAGYNLMVGNGSVGTVPSGQRAEEDMFKKFYGDVWVKLWHKRIIIDAYADHERTQLSDPSTGLPFHKSKYTYKGFLAYRSDKFTIGVEAFRQTLYHFSIYTRPGIAKADTATTYAIGISGFLRGAIYKDRLGFFGRYDFFNPDTKYNNDYIYETGNISFTERFITAGLDWMPLKNLHFMPNVWLNYYDDRIKGAQGRAKKDYDMSVRLTFYYVCR